MKRGTKITIGVSVGVVVLLVVVLIVVLSKRKKNIITPKPDEPDQPDQPKTVDPIDDVIDKGKDIIKNLPIYVPGPGGEPPPKPTPIPIQGQYYQPPRVNTGKMDQMVNIARAAGLPGFGWRTMRDHVKNAWIPRGPDKNSENQINLKVNPRYTAPGYQTAYEPRTTPKTVYPVIYVPLISEVIA